MIEVQIIEDPLYVYMYCVPNKQHQNIFYGYFFDQA